MTNKSQDAYKTIGEVAEILNLFNPKTKKSTSLLLRILFNLLFVLREGVPVSANSSIIACVIVTIKFIYRYPCDKTK